MRANAVGHESEVAFFWRHVDKQQDCWLWTGKIQSQGYGRVCFRCRAFYAHRYSYELVHGPIPAGLHLDHLCHNRDPLCTLSNLCPHRRCVNPAHLEAVLPKINASRGRRGQQAECIHGHAFSPENTYIRSDGGGRQCIACNYIRTCKRLGRCKSPWLHREGQCGQPIKYAYMRP